MINENKKAVGLESFFQMWTSNQFSMAEDLVKPQNGVWLAKEPFLFPYIAQYGGTRVQCRTKAEAEAKYCEMKRARTWKVEGK